MSKKAIEFLFHCVSFEEVSNIIMVYIVLLVLWIISFASWLAWLIGYLIYKKNKREKVFDGGFTYAAGLLIGSSVMSIFDLFMKIVGSNF